MRSCSSAIFSLASPVMIVEERSVTSGVPGGSPDPPASPVEPASAAVGNVPCHSSQSPANANGSPSGRWMYQGCLRLAPSGLFHS